MDRVLPPPPPPAVPSRRRGLLVAGLLLLVAPFLYANPWLDTGDTRWPWAALADQPLSTQVEVASIATVALGAILAAVGLGGRALLFVVIAGASFHAIRLHGEPGAFRFLAVEAFGLGGFVVTTVLGVGLRLVGRGDPRARTVGRTLVVAGAIWAAALAGGCFYGGGKDVAARTLVEDFVVRWPERIAAITGVGGGAAGDRTRVLVEDVVARMVPELLMAAAVLLALVASVRSRGAGVRGGGVAARIGFAALLGAWLVPSAAQILDLALHAVGGRAAAVFGALGDLILGTGFGLFAVLVFAIDDAVATARVASDAGLPGAPSGTLVRRGTFGVALALGVASTFTHFRPERGLFARVWPWAVPGGPSVGWDPLAAVLAADVVFLLCAVAGLVARPNARVARALAMGFGVALLVVASALHRSMTTPFVYFRVAAYVPFLLAGVAVGAVLGGATRTRRVVAAIAALVLLGLFFSPVPPPVPSATPSAVVVAAPGEYHSVATIGLESTSTIRGYFLDLEPRFGCPGTVFWLTALSGAVLVSAMRPPRRVGRGVLLAIFAVACAWPVAQLLLGDATSGPGVDRVTRALLAFEYLVLGPAWAAAAVLALRFSGPTSASASN